MVRAAADGRDLLNLFAYTGSFTVYAAAGGARRTVTVDLSRTYQAWSQRNLALNGLDAAGRHHFVQEDTMAFLERTRRSGARFDLVVLDPPSFSNSKRMDDSFDVQRDQLPLLRAALGVLAPGGSLYFSNNRRGFRLDPAIADEAEVTEITQRTVPPDFRRFRPHRCWILRR
jgi:23S rRNA (cytosine1962-C5)-methyltransferase